MAKIVTYEVLYGQGKTWTIESAHQDREEALHQAREIVESRYSRSSVRVLQETYDDVSGDTVTTIVFSHEGEAAMAKPKASPGQKGKQSTVITDRPMRDRRPVRRAPKPDRGGDAFLRYVLLLVVSLGGIALVVIAAVLLYLNSVGA